MDRFTIKPVHAEFNLLSSSADGMHRAFAWSSTFLPGVEVSTHSHFGAIERYRLLPMVQFRTWIAGEVELRCGSETWRQGRGGSLLVAPECNFRVARRITETALTLRVYIAPRIFDEWMLRHGGPRSTEFHVRFLEDPTLGDALHDLERRMREAADAFALCASFDRLLHRTLHSLSTSEEKCNVGRAEVRKAVEFLRERFADSVSLDELADIAGLSKFHLVRLFRDQVGVAPHAYHLQLRISRARELLASGISVAEVAVACGFADQAHFSRCFKSAVGYTPGAFQRLG